MFNLKEIMRNAWVQAENAVFLNGVGTKVEYFAECLKEEWVFQKQLKEASQRKELVKKAKRIAKTKNEISAIKSWFVRKNFTEQEAYVINSNDWIEVIEETQKAYRLRVHNADFGNITTWAPKSCCVA